jgi:hypothetical protein
VDVRIGVTHSPKEIELELSDDTDRDGLLKELDALLGKGDGVCWLTDRRGRRVGVPVPKIAYVEVGTSREDRRVGFGVP